jgi:hypothetical protein
MKAVKRIKQVSKGCYKFTHKGKMNMFSQYEWKLSAKGIRKLLLPVAYLRLWIKMALLYIKIRGMNLRISIDVGYD